MNTSVRQQILEGLEELNQAFPDWRFGQMVANLAVVARGATAEAIWDMEDEELLAAIQQLLVQQAAQQSVVL